MTVASTADGQALDPAVLVIFGTVAVLSGALAWLALAPQAEGTADSSAGRAHVGAA